MAEFGALLGGAAALIAALVAAIGIPIALYQMRHSERQRALSILEQTILDNFARLETRTHDAGKFDFDDDEAYTGATAEVRRLVALVALLEHRHDLQAITPATSVWFIREQVGNELAHWAGFLAGYLSAMLDEDHSQWTDKSKRELQRVLRLRQLTSCESIAPDLFEQIADLETPDVHLFERAKALAEQFQGEFVQKAKANAS